MPIRWKIFKAIAVLQLIFVTYKAFTSFAALFFAERFLFPILDITHLWPDARLCNARFFSGQLQFPRNTVVDHTKKMV